MNQQTETGANQAPTLQCSNSACQTTFTSPVQHCLTCGALLKDALLSERFRVEALLGRGGMGAVYRATDLALGRAVALKVLSPSAGLAGDAPQELRARFFREARLAAQLDHPNIVPVLHFDIDGPLAYLVMPLLTGGTLAKQLRPRQPTDPVAMAGWLHQIGAALDYAHERPQPIVHRDVKPGNLLFHEDGRLCLADFGIARVAAGVETGEAAHLTRTGIVMGSLSYMAPEQINGRAVPASDQYSAGVVLYEALTGVLPFDAADNYGLIIQHASATPTLPSEHVPSLSGGVDAVILRALAKEPAERFPTVGALAEAFEAALTGAPTAQVAAPYRHHVTRPVAVARSTAQLDDAQDVNAPLPDDLRGERPTEAATLLRPPPGQTGAFWGAPPQYPQAAPRRNWLMPVLFGGLAVILLCVLGLAGLSAFSHATQPQASQTASAVPSPSPTPSEAQRYENLLTAAESSNNILFQDNLTKDSHKAWVVSPPGAFASDGLRLPTRTVVRKGGNNNNTMVLATIARQLTLSDIEVNVTVTSDTVGYGLALYTVSASSNHALVLSAGGGYQAEVGSGTRVIVGQNLPTNPDLALTPGTTHSLEVIVQRTQFVIFLNHIFITTAPFSTDFSGSGAFALFSVIQNNGQEDGQVEYVTFSHLNIYALPQGASINA